MNKNKDRCLLVLVWAFHVSPPQGPSPVSYPKRRILYHHNWPGRCWQNCAAKCSLLGRLTDAGTDFTRENQDII